MDEIKRKRNEIAAQAKRYRFMVECYYEPLAPPVGRRYEVGQIDELGDWNPAHVEDALRDGLIVVEEA